MSTSLGSHALRWIVPGAVAAAVAVGSLASSVNASASGSPKLAPRQAAQLLATLEQAQTPQLSGTVVETVNLGLPDLSSLTGSSGGSADLSLQNLVSGSHTVRVFYGGADKQRFALLGTLSESDVVHNGNDLWTYSSSTHEVQHATLPSRTDKPETLAPAVAGLTPMAEAQKALAAIDPTTTVTMGPTAHVAGRSVYQILLTPKDSRSLIGTVRIALDSATSMPLRVQVFAAGASSPAVQIGFTDVTFGAPNASVFDFKAPAGTTVTPLKNPMTDGGMPRLDRARAKARVEATPDAKAAHTDPKVLGSGWTAVVEVTSPDGAIGGSVGALLDKAATRVPGGRVVTSALVTVLITDDGRIFAGPVSAADLAKVAATGKAL